MGSLRDGMNRLPLSGLASINGGKNAALVVEDDAIQREVIAELLRDHGLEVVECSSAETAELVLASTGTELVALITDVNLGGGMSGVELAQYAKRMFPHLNVVMISG